MTQELQDRIIHALGGYTAEEFDAVLESLQKASEAKADITSRLHTVIAEVDKDELENLTATLGDNLEGWRNLLLNCRLGAMVRTAADITDYGSFKEATVVVLAKEDANERNSKAD